MSFYGFENYDKFENLDFITRFKKEARLLNPVKRVLFIIDYVKENESLFAKYFHVIRSIDNEIIKYLTEKAGLDLPKTYNLDRNTFEETSIFNDDEYSKGLKALETGKIFEDFTNCITGLFSKTIISVFEQNKIQHNKKETYSIINNNDLALISPLIMDWNTWTDVIKYKLNLIEEAQFNVEKTRLVSLLNELSFRLDSDFLPKLTKSNPILNKRHPLNPYLFLNVKDGDSIVVDNPIHLNKTSINEMSHESLNINKYKQFIQEIQYNCIPKKLTILAPYKIIELQNLINHYFEAYSNNSKLLYKKMAYWFTQEDITIPAVKFEINRQELTDILSLFKYLKDKKVINFSNESLYKLLEFYFDVGMTTHMIKKYYSKSSTELSSMIKFDFNRLIDKKQLSDF